MSKKRNPAQFAAAKKFAVEVSGYGPNSPIWGKRLPDVLSGIEEGVRAAVLDLDGGGTALARNTLIDSVLVTIEELKKRVAKQAIISSQMK